MITQSNCASCGKAYIMESVEVAGRTVAGNRHCPTCTKRMSDEESAAALAAIESMWAEVCPVEYANTDLDRIAGSREIVAKMAAKLGSTLYGPSGGGKTRLAWVRLRSIWESGKSVLGVRATKFSYAAGRMHDDEKQAALIARCHKVGALLLDDLGKGSTSPSAQREFYDLIEDRMSRRLVTILTTNATRDQFDAYWSDEYKEPITRRLKEYCTVMKIDKIKKSPCKAQELAQAEDHGSKQNNERNTIV